jgi:hypothetical protein
MEPLSDVPKTPEEAVVRLLNGMNKGQYTILIEAIRQLGGEMHLDEGWVDSVMLPVPAIEVVSGDGPVVLLRVGHLPPLDL